MNMLMEIDPLPMRGSMVIISPSRRDVSSAEQLRRSPRLVPPRFRLETATLHPESFLVIFFREKDFIYQKMGTRGLLGGPRGRGARPPPMWLAGGPPLVLSSSNIFYLFQNDSP